MSFQITISDRTFAKFVEAGKALNIQDANECFEACVDAMIDQLNVQLADKGNEEFIKNSDDCMLHPSGFEGANAVFGPPQGKTEDEVYSLIGARIIWGEDPAVLTCWKPTEAQIERLKVTGRLWLSILYPGMVPVCLTTEKPTVFPNVNFAK